MIPTQNSIEDAHERIKNLINRTPLLSSGSVNKIAGCEIYFKCENFQKVGAFKFRGASNAVSKLNDDEMKAGVATHSSGNHAAALTLAAKLQGAEAYIVMPRTAPEIKKKAVKSYGANITFCEPTLQAREETLNKIVGETNSTFVHPYDNYNIIEGQATCAKEIYEELQGLDYVVAPVGGGGLMSGTCLSTKYFSPETIIIGAEPKGADDAYRSVKENKIYPSINPNTIADGLLTSLSEKTFGIIKEHVQEIILVDDSEIIEAMRLIWERMKIIVEPSSATVLAAILKSKEMFLNKRVGAILSGGNVDLANLPF